MQNVPASPRTKEVPRCGWSQCESGNPYIQMESNTDASNLGLADIAMDKIQEDMHGDS